MEPESKPTADAAFLTNGRSRKGTDKPHQKAIGFSLLVCALISILTTVGIIAVLVNDSIFNFAGEKAFFQQVSLKQFLFDTRWLSDIPVPRFGIWPLIMAQSWSPELPA